MIETIQAAERVNERERERERLGEREERERERKCYQVVLRPLPNRVDR